MAEKNSFDRQPPDRVLIIERVFDAPPSVVFNAFTDPKQSEQWWGPRGYTATHVEMDVRPGGAWRSCLRSADRGEELWQGGIYREVVEPERLVFTFAWDDENGRRGPETLVTMTFAEHDGKTKFTLHQALFESVDMRDSHQGGWTESFDRLEEFLTRPTAS
jgi:uncharacterized protein YndB with AHSA1/START domain